MIVEHGDVSVRELPDVVLVGKGLTVDELEHIGLASQTPDHVTCLQVDLRDFAEIPAREQQIAIVRQDERIPVHQVDLLIRQTGGRIKKRKMVPTSPFEDHILGWIEFLNDQSGNGRILFPALNDLAHVHDHRIICHQQRVAVRQELEIVQIGDIAVSSLVTIDHLVM
jgi:hypothetical protein